MSVTIAAAHAYAEARRGRRLGAPQSRALRKAPDPQPRPSSAGAVWWANMLGIALLVALLVAAGIATAEDTTSAFCERFQFGYSLVQISRKRLRELQRQPPFSIETRVFWWNMLEVVQLPNSAKRAVDGSSCGAKQPKILLPLSDRLWDDPFRIEENIFLEHLLVSVGVGALPAAFEDVLDPYPPVSHNIYKLNRNWGGAKTHIQLPVAFAPCPTQKGNQQRNERASCGCYAKELRRSDVLQHRRPGQHDGTQCTGAEAKNIYEHRISKGPKAFHSSISGIGARILSDARPACNRSPKGCAAPRPSPKTLFVSCGFAVSRGPLIRVPSCPREHNAGYHGVDHCTERQATQPYGHAHVSKRAAARGCPEIQAGAAIDQIHAQTLDQAPELEPQLRPSRKDGENAGKDRCYRRQTLPHDLNLPLSPRDSTPWATVPAVPA